MGCVCVNMKLVGIWWRENKNDDAVERRKLGVNKERTTVALKGFIWSISHKNKLVEWKALVDTMEIFFAFVAPWLFARSLSKSNTFSLRICYNWWIQNNEFHGVNGFDVSNVYVSPASQATLQWSDLGQSEIFGRSSFKQSDRKVTFSLERGRSVLLIDSPNQASSTLALDHANL